MKKKILVLFLVLAMAFNLVGCNTTGLSLLGEMKKATAWDAMEVKGDVTLDLQLFGQTVTIMMDYAAYSNTKNMQMEMELAIKEIKMSDQLKGLFPQPVTFSPIKMYMDGMKYYISTSFIEEVCQLVGMNAAEIMDITKDYIALDMNSVMEMSGIDISNIALLVDESFKMFEASKVEMPMTQEGRKYTIELNADQMIDAFITWTQESADSDMVMQQYQSMGMSVEQIEQLKNEVITIYEQIKPAMKEALQGSVLSMVYDFKDKAYESIITGDIKVNIDSMVCQLKLNCNESVREVEAREVEFPTNVIVYNYEEIIRQLMPVVYFKQSDILQKDGVNYIPFRAAMKQIGVEVTYDAVTKKTGIVLEGMVQEVPTMIVNGTAYISEEMLMTLGLGLIIQ